MLKTQRIALLTLSLAGFTVASQARDYGQYNDVSPAIRSWIESLKDFDGFRCCATADGVETDAWQMQKDHYRIKINGQWFNVPDAAVVGGPNLLGHAVVWVLRSEFGVFGVRCFLPGAQS